jgi:hypothetical protein
MKFSEKLKERYAAEIKEGSIWAAIEADKFDSIQIDEGRNICRNWGVGEAINIFPSGKIYMPWTTNQNMRDVIRDQAFNEALEEAAEAAGVCVDYYDGYMSLCICDGDASESYITYDGGDTFRYFGKEYKGSEVKENMFSEGYFPSVYAGNERDGELFYFDLDELAA